jgi:hypothetical protein
MAQRESSSAGVLTSALQRRCTNNIARWQFELADQFAETLALPRAG